MGFSDINGFKFERIENQNVASGWGNMIGCRGSVRCMGVDKVYWG